MNTKAHGPVELIDQRVVEIADAIRTAGGRALVSSTADPAAVIHMPR